MNKRKQQEAEENETLQYVWDADNNRWVLQEQEKERKFFSIQATTRQDNHERDHQWRFERKKILGQQSSKKNKHEESLAEHFPSLGDKSAPPPPVKKAKQEVVKRTSTNPWNRTSTENKATPGKDDSNPWGQTVELNVQLRMEANNEKKEEMTWKTKKRSIKLKETKIEPEIVQKTDDGAEASEVVMSHLFDLALKNRKPKKGALLVRNKIDENKKALAKQRAAIQAKDPKAHRRQIMDDGTFGKQKRFRRGSKRKPTKMKKIIKNERHVKLVHSILESLVHKVWLEKEGLEELSLKKKYKPSKEQKRSIRLRITLKGWFTKEKLETRTEYMKEAVSSILAIPVDRVSYTDTWQKEVEDIPENSAQTTLVACMALTVLEAEPSKAIVELLRSEEGQRKLTVAFKKRQVNMDVQNITCEVFTEKTLQSNKAARKRQRMRNTLRKELPDEFVIAERLVNLHCGDPTIKIFQPRVRGYVDQILSPSLNKLVKELLEKLIQFFKNAKQKAKGNVKTQRRVCCGLREVLKLAKFSDINGIIVAPNIEKIETQQGLDDMVLSIIKEARERNIPVTFALSRKKLGDCLWVKSRVSAVAVIDVSGAHDVWSKILNLTRSLREQYKMSKFDFMATTMSLKDLNWGSHMNEKLAAIEMPQLQDQVQIRRKQDGDAEKKRTKKKRRRPRKKKKKAASSENHPKEQRRRKERKLPRQKYQGRGKDMSPPNQRLPQFFKQGFVQYSVGPQFSKISKQGPAPVTAPPMTEFEPVVGYETYGEEVPMNQQHFQYFGHYGVAYPQQQNSMYYNGAAS